MRCTFREGSKGKTMKYKMTHFKNRYKTEGTLVERTFEEIYLIFKTKVRRTSEKYNEYIASEKKTQLAIKDVGGFIGGQTENNLRSNYVRVKRQLLTLDIDSKYPNVFDFLSKTVDFYCFVHTTHKHNAFENRFRLIAPLSREVNEDEYEAVGRRIAYSIENSKNGVMQGLFDETTFQANRLMFYPSVSADGEYICEVLNLNMADESQNIIDVDKILSTYLDANDIYEWFKPSTVNEELAGRGTKINKNPLKAKGLVGAFNRTYSITEAIDEFLPHIYKQERNGRYTFIGGGSYGGGLVLNDNSLFYSHHGTDPANTYYRSAFDLVRIHLFGKHDSGFTPEKIIEKDILEKTVSFEKMIDFCKTLPNVLKNSDNAIDLARKIEEQNKFIGENFSEQDTTKEIINSDDVVAKEATFEELKKELDVLTKEQEVEAPAKVENESWIPLLSNVKSKSGKLDIIFTNDKNIGNLFYYDTFRENICFSRKPFWKKTFEIGMAVQDKDLSHIRNYLEKVYDIVGDKVIEDAIVVEADKIQVNKVLDFFEGLKWDGKERLEFFFNDFFKVPLNPFTRVAFKHWLVGAVSRIYKAGSPFDLLLIIKGEQGIGKSLFFKRLATLDFNKEGEHLYSDTKINFDTKDSYEQLEGIWIYEWKELAGMNMSEQESIKAFIDKTEDKFRRSYGKRNVEIKRRVAFGGTTNDDKPLRDRSGNRRFLVYESNLKRYECYINDDKKFTQEYRDQLLAEAIHLYKSGYQIFKWSEEEYNWWEKTNELNLTTNDFQGVIDSYLQIRRPARWYSMSEIEMSTYLSNYDFDRNKPSHEYLTEVLVPVERVCLPELYRVVLKQAREITINRFHRELLIQALRNLGWNIQKKQARFGCFGHQYEVIKEKDIHEDEIEPKEEIKQDLSTVKPARAEDYEFEEVELHEDDLPF